MKYSYFFMMVLFCVQGCTYRAWYEGIHESQRQDCYEYSEPERSKCLERMNQTYDEYMKEREETIMKDSRE